jgi:hypothetical protein
MRIIGNIFENRIMGKKRPSPNGDAIHPALGMVCETGD